VSSTESADRDGTDPTLHIRNEFAAVSMRRVSYGRGTRLEVTSERTGRVASLDATILEALTALSPEELVSLVGHAVSGDGSGTDEENEQRHRR
jgi:hypothetical protein